MATTNKGIYYPNNYSNVADVPEDMKKLAESVDTQISNLDTNKVDKVDGKGLSTNDYTNEDKAKLDSLENYDDTAIKQDIEDIQEEQAKQNEDIEDLKQINAKQDDLIQKLKDNSINVTTEEATSLHVTDASTLPAKLEVRGNHRQKVTKTAENIFDGKLELGAWDYNTGEKVDNSSQMRSTDYIDVEGQTQISIVKKDGGAFTVGIRYYADDKTYIGRASINNATDAITTTIVNDIDDTKSVKYATLTFIHSTDTSEVFAVNKGADLEWHDFIPDSPSLDYPSPVRAVGDNVNILPNEATSQTEGELEWTVNTDGSVHVVGTASSNALYLKKGTNNTEEVFRFRANKQYKNVGNVDILYQKTDGAYARKLKGEIFEYEEDELINKLYLQIPSGETVDETYYPKIVEYHEGMDESYSPYEQGSVEVKKINKNWAKIDTPRTVERSGLNIEVDNEGVFTLNGTTTANMYINLINIEEYQNTTLTNYKLPLKKYKAYFDLIQKNNSAVSESNGDASFNIRNFAASSTGEQAISYCVFGGLIKGNTGVQIKDCNITDGRVVAYLYVANGVKLDNFKFRFALYNEDEPDTTYEKYEESSYILDIQKPMLLGDYFDLERGKEVHHWDTVSFDGTESSWYYTPDANHRFRVFFNNTSLNTPNQFCSHSKMWSAWGMVFNSFCVRSPSYAFFNNEAFNEADLEKFKAWLAEQEEAGTPLTYWYECEEYELDLTEDQKAILKQLQELELLKGTNNIITAESLALMQLSYIADTQSYIDSQIDEKLANINQQLLEIVGGN